MILNKKKDYFKFGLTDFISYVCRMKTILPVTEARFDKESYQQLVRSIQKLESTNTDLKIKLKDVIDKFENTMAKLQEAGMRFEPSVLDSPGGVIIFAKHENINDKGPTFYVKEKI